MQPFSTGAINTVKSAIILQGGGGISMRYNGAFPNNHPRRCSLPYTTSSVTRPELSASIVTSTHLNAGVFDCGSVVVGTNTFASG